MTPGDRVLQPPQIRQRVLACSDGPEVAEVSGPAEHPTLADRFLGLPDPRLDRDRVFGG